MTNGSLSAPQLDTPCSQRRRDENESGSVGGLHADVRTGFISERLSGMEETCGD
jgi:hypothetical protein